MEKHHKLRRPQGSSIHGCNICGKEGHQAAVCPNGTSINWPEKFGPLWTVDLDALAAKQREPDYKAIAERARARSSPSAWRRRRRARAPPRGPAGGKMPTARAREPGRGR